MGTLWLSQSNKSVNADAQSRFATASRRSLVAGYVRRYEGMALSASSGKTFRFRTARVRGLGAPAWSLVWGWHAWHSLLCGSMVFGAGRNASATAPASLALVSGASPAGLQAWVVITNSVGARIAFLRGRSAQPGAMPPCSGHNSSMRATASHNRSVNADAQGRPAAAPRLSLVAGYVRR